LDTPWNLRNRWPVVFDRPQSFRRWEATTALALAAVIVLVVGATGGVLAWRDQDVWAVCGAVTVAGIVLVLLIARLAAGPPRRLLARQDQLVALAAHEVRRPLARLEALATDGQEDPILWLSQVLAVSNDAAHTIDDLLTLGGLVASGSPLRLEPVRLDVLVADALDERMLTSLVRTDLSPVVVMAHPILRRVVVNLVDNAREHGRRGSGTPVVDVTVRPFELVVADQGPGMERGLLEAVNDPLGSGEHGAGLGIGLTLVAWVVNALGGEVCATNREGGGLHVSVRLRGVVEASGEVWSRPVLTKDRGS
jgi:signal transduction histidine kinase